MLARLCLRQRLGIDGRVLAVTRTEPALPPGAVLPGRDIAGDVAAHQLAAQGRDDAHRLCLAHLALVPVRGDHVTGKHILVDAEVGALALAGQGGGQGIGQGIEAGKSPKGGRHAQAPRPTGVHAAAPVAELAGMQRTQVVLPGMAGANIGRGDARDMHMRYRRMHGDAPHPGAAMHTPGKAHVVRMVVQHHHPQRARGAEALAGDAVLDQQPGQVVKIATAHPGRAMLRRQLGLQMAAELLVAAQRCAKADRLLPVAQRQAQLTRQWADGAIDIQHQRGHRCSCHARSLSKCRENRRPKARSSGLRM